MARARLLALWMAAGTFFLAGGCGQPQAVDGPVRSGADLTPVALRGVLPEALRQPRVPTLVACRFAHEVYQKTPSGSWLDITGDWYRRALQSEREAGKVSAQRKFTVLGRLSLVEALAREVSTELAAQPVGDLLGTLWIPEPSADTLVTPAATKVLNAADVPAAEPLVWMTLDLTVTHSPNNYDKWVEVTAGLVQLQVGEDSLEAVKAFDETIRRIRKAFSDPLPARSASVVVDHAEEAPRPIPLTLAGPRQTPVVLQTPMGALLGEVSGPEGDVYSPGLGRIQAMTDDTMQLDSPIELRSRTVIDAAGGEASLIEALRR